MNAAASLRAHVMVLLILAPLPEVPLLSAADCNGNGSSDESDLLTGRSADCNRNGIPDECDLVPDRLEFAPAEVFPLWFVPQLVAAADLDGDRRPELISGNGVSPGLAKSTLSVFPNDGRGGFGPALILPLNENSRALAVSDLDSDGHPDLVAANYTSKDLSLFLNRDGAGFAGAVRAPLGGPAVQLTAG